MSAWIEFTEAGWSASGRTRIWRVEPKQVSGCIGEISWYSPWRRYCFFPIANSVFEEQCLRDIAKFCEDQTAAHKAKRGHQEEAVSS